MVKATWSNLLVFVLIFFLLSCGGNTDERDWERAKAENTIQGFEYYRSHHTTGKHLNEVDNFVEAIHLKQALYRNTIPILVDYLGKYPNGAGVDRVRERVHQLKQERHPDVRDAKSLRILVEKSLGEAKGVQLPFAGEAAKFLDIDLSGIEIIENSERQVDLILKIQVKGRALSERYMAIMGNIGGINYSGAFLKGIISLIRGDKVLMQERFSGEKKPPKRISSSYDTPSDAPFLAVFQQEYLPALYGLIADVFGDSIVINILRKERRHRDMIAEYLVKSGWRPKTDVGKSYLLLAEGDLRKMRREGGPQTAIYLADELRCGDLSTVSFLERRGWQPADDRERAYYHIAKGDFKKCVQLGWAAVPPLIKGLTYTTEKMRAQAADALFKIGWKPRNHRETIVWLVASDRRNIPGELENTAARLGTDAVRPLIAAFDYVSPDGREKFEAVAKALAKVGPDAVPILIQALGQKKSQWGVVQALGEIGDPRAVSPLLNLINNSRYWALQVQAIEALGKTKYRQGLEALLGFLRHPDYRIRSAAARALGGHANPDAIDPLINALEDNNKVVRRSCIKSLSKFDNPRAKGAIFSALKDKDKDIRKYAVEVLGGKKDPTTVDHLIPLLKDLDYHVRLSTVRALDKLGDKRAVIALIEALRDRHSQVQSSVMLALRDIGDERAVGPLIEAMKDGTVNDHTNTTIAIMVLQKLTGKNPGRDKNAWIQWWKNEGK